MTPAQLLINSTADLLAADTGTLGAVAAMHVHLVISPFTPSPDLDITGLTLATFTGSTPKNVGTGTQNVFVDPNSGYTIIQLLEPVGGFTWICTVAPSPAERVYGVIVTDNADAVLIGSELLGASVLVSAIGDAVTLPWLRLTMAVNPWS